MFSCISYSDKIVAYWDLPDNYVKGNSYIVKVDGKKVGETLDYGGLFGFGPVMKVNTASPAKFISRGGQIPSPMHSIKN